MFYNSTGLRFALQNFEECWGFSLFLDFYCWEFSLLFSLCRKDLSSFPCFLLFLLYLLFLLLTYFSSFLIKKKKKVSWLQWEMAWCKALHRLGGHVARLG